MRFLIALNRGVGRQVYDWLVSIDDAPCGVILPAHADEFALSAGEDARARGIPVFEWRDEACNLQSMQERLEPELLLSIHFPEILPDLWLRAFRRGCVNLHPAFLPWGRGWHTPTWAILDGTPIGASLHYMTPELDAGDIIDQQRVVVSPKDTAHTLYQRVLRAEYDLFVRTWPALRAGTASRTPQPTNAAAGHRRRDLNEHVRKIDLDAASPGRHLLTKLRALTTDRWDEAAWFEEDGQHYAVRVEVRQVEP